MVRCCQPVVRGRRGRCNRRQSPDVVSLFCGERAGNLTDVLQHRQEIPAKRLFGKRAIFGHDQQAEEEAARAPDEVADSVEPFGKRLPTIDLDPG